MIGFVAMAMILVGLLELAETLFGFQLAGVSSFVILLAGIALFAVAAIQEDAHATNESESTEHGPDRGGVDRRIPEPRSDRDRVHS